MSTDFSKGMVDVGHKKPTRRTAVAQAKVCLGQKAWDGYHQHGSRKGDVIETARAAGVLAAKNVCHLIPYCHPLALDKVSLTFRWVEEQQVLLIESQVITTARTGVEMEALTAVSVAALTVYDMLKGYDKGIVVENLRLLRKTGGKSGPYQSDRNKGNV